MRPRQRSDRSPWMFPRERPGRRRITGHVVRARLEPRRNRDVVDNDGRRTTRVVAGGVLRGDHQRDPGLRVRAEVVGVGTRRIRSAVEEARAATVATAHPAIIPGRCTRAAIRAQKGISNVELVFERRPRLAGEGPRRRGVARVVVGHAGEGQPRRLAVEQVAVGRDVRAAPAWIALPHAECVGAVRVQRQVVALRAGAGRVDRYRAVGASGAGTRRSHRPGPRSSTGASKCSMGWSARPGLGGRAQCRRGRRQTPPRRPGPGQATWP